MDVMGPVTYWINLPESWKIHNVFYASLLRQYKETKVYGANYPRPPPEIEEGEEVYEVESILKHRRRVRAISILSNGVGTLSPKHHGNQNTCSQKMVTY